MLHSFLADSPVS